MAGEIQINRGVESQNTSPIPKSTEADQNNTQEVSEKAVKLTKVNTILGILDFEFNLNGDQENEYRNKLLSKTPEELEKISKKTPKEILEYLDKMEEVQETEIKANKDTENGDNTVEEVNNGGTLEEQIINIQSQIDNISKQIIKLNETAETDEDIEKIMSLEEKVYNLRNKVKKLETEKREQEIDETQLVNLEKEKNNKLIDANNNLENANEILENAKNEIVEKDFASLKSLLSELDLANYGGLKEKFNKFTNENDLYKRKGILESILKEFTNSKTLRNVANDLKEKDEVDGGNRYEEFKNTVIGLDASLDTNFDLRSEFDKYEAEIIPNKFSLVVGTLGNIKVSGDTLTHETDDGFKITAGKDSRTLSLNGSDYELGAPLNNQGERKDVDESERDMAEKIEPLNKDLNSISKIIKYLEYAILKAVSLNDIKTEIASKIPFKLYNEIGVESATSLQDLKNRLDGIYAKKKEEKERLLEEKRGKLEEIVRRNTEMAREKDEKTKATLKFLHSIGFDLIPQSVSTDIIRLINLEKGMYGMQEDIDLANGKLGFREVNGELDSVSNKKKFAELINIMLSGEKTRPINIDSVGALGNPTFVGEIDEPLDYTEVSKDILDKLGAHPKSVILGNMEKFKVSKQKKSF